MEKQTEGAAMKWKALRNILIVLLGVFIMFAPNRHTRSCGPFLSFPVLTFSSHPDMPLSNYAAGKLSVLQPGYARSYLVVAYRYLSGNTFTPQEQVQLDSVWDYRVNGGRYSDWSNESGGARAWHKLILENSDANDAAKYARLDSLGFDYNYYSYSQNFNTSTWQTASAVLLERVQKFGKSSEEVRNWIDGEVKLLEPGDSDHAPRLAPASASPTVRWDREYQNAVGYFYMTKYSEAISEFSRIAEENGSPWQATGAYMLIRCHIRKGIMKEDSTDLGEMEAARKQIDVLQSDSRFASMKNAAEELRGYVLCRLEPGKQLDDLAIRLASEHHPETLFSDLIDYTTILTRLVPSPYRYDQDHAQHVVPSSKAELTDWISTFTLADPEAKAHALERWQTTRSQAWLCAALTKALTADAGAQVLIAAAMKLDESSPAYIHCRYHALRLMIDLGQKDESRKQLDAMLSRTDLTVGGRNLFRGLRLSIDGTLSDWVHDAQATPAGITDESDPSEGLELSSDSIRKITPKYASVLDYNATYSINAQTPLTTILAICNTTELAADIRRDLAIVGWTRSYLLKESELSMKFASIAGGLSPELKKFTDIYLSALSPADRDHAAFDLIAHAPGVALQLEYGLRRDEEVTKLDNLRDNWWCPLTLREWSSSMEQDDGDSPKSAREAIDSLELRFLTRNDRQNAAQQVEALRAVPTAPNFLISGLLDWAKSTPDDPRIPEDLHRAVVASHIGCADSTTTPLSKAAWKLLHSKYKNSPWTQKTPYYY
jgi:hypothetical protein